MIASATQVKVKGVRGYINLFLFVRRIRGQTRETPGLISSHYKGLRTLTLWENMESMQNFRNSGSHLDAMKNSNTIGKTKSLSWEVTELPQWKDVISKLSAQNYHT